MKARKHNWRPRRWLKVTFSAIAAVLILITAVSAEAVYHFNRAHDQDPVRYGFTFSAEYASYYGLDPKQTLEALFKELKPDRVRLLSYWDQVEKQRDKYNFDGLDWQMDLARKYGVEVSLSVGLRQPRYPECHYPEWAKPLSDQEIYDELMPFITAVVQRYKHEPALGSYQLENEALLTIFGLCRHFSREQLDREYQLIKRLDPVHPVGISLSNEFGLPIRGPHGDEVGFSLYRRVYEHRVLKRYVNYPTSPLWFRVRAAIVERYIGGHVYVHELQAEPWGPTGITNMSIEEQDKAYSADRIGEAARFAKASGLHEIDFWGPEWWYWRKVKLGDPSVWDAAKEVFATR